MSLLQHQSVKWLDGRKRILELSLIVWVLGFLLSTVIMWFLGIQPESETEHWGINHPKYFQFETIMILSMVVLMFIITWFFYTYDEYSGTMVDVLIDGLVVMIMQFIMDFIVLVSLFGSGLSYFYGLVTLSYLSIPFQWLIFTWIRKQIKF